MSEASVTGSGFIWKAGRYLSLVKFSHTIFALPFALIGFVLGVYAYSGAAVHQPFLLFIKVVLCMVFARSAAMAFNRYLDRSFDALNPRTASREVPAGIISARAALLFTLANCALFILTTWFINAWCFYLSFVALFVILFYSYTKRFTPLCHLVLGLGLSLAPIGAYLAATGVFHLLPILFSAVVVCWVSGFDIIYALQDASFDRSQKLHSIPVLLGVRNALRVSNFLHFLSASFVILAGIKGKFHPLYWGGAAIFICLLAYQHFIVSPKNLSRINIAFANTNGLASLLFAIFTIAAILLK